MTDDWKAKAGFEGGCPLTRHLILGTAGHIDHGKTSLVRRLTGIDTDRLPEERQRGITIDLGFAFLDVPGFRFGIVDVPGHERFVHNMVAGATGVDLALLVVAADDSVMPQTIEHLAILDLLGVAGAVVAITKIDLVDEDHLAMVREEIRVILADTPLRAAPLSMVSSATGAGIEELKETLRAAAGGLKSRRSGALFRMPIDRSFAVAGHGTVVTGTVLGGQAQSGDSLCLMPAGVPVRARRIQSHQEENPRAEAGQRAAINLAGIKHDEVHRGDELTVPGYLTPARRMLVKGRLLASAARPLENRSLVRLHLGTREVTCRAILRDGPLAPGAEAYFELRGQDWLLAEHGQRFILRQLSPPITIGGGVVLDPFIPVGQRLGVHSEWGRRLDQNSPGDRLAAFLVDHDLEDWDEPRLASKLGIDPAERDGLVKKLRDQGILASIGGHKGPLTHRGRRDRLGDQVRRRVERQLALRQPARTIERSAVLAACRRLAPARVLEAVLVDLVARNELEAVADRLALPGQGARLTRQQNQLLSDLVAASRAGGLAPPSLGEFAKAKDIAVKDLAALVAIALEDRTLMRIGEELLYTPEALEEARETVIACIETGGPATVADLKEAWKVSRKYAVPLCEYFDSRGVTVRQGDARALGPSARETTLRSEGRRG